MFLVNDNIVLVFTIITKLYQYIIVNESFKLTDTSI